MSSPPAELFSSVIMVVAITPDPEAFDADTFNKNDRYGQITQLITRHLDHNGVIMIDGSGEILDLTKKNIEDLEYINSDKIKIFIAEILKSKNKRIFRVNGIPNVDLYEKCVLVTERSHSEAIITSPSNKEFYLKNLSTSEVVTYEDYHESELSTKLHNYIEGQIHTDNVDKAEFDAIISKFLRFSRRLYFYDKQIGKGNNITGFSEGIEYIISIFDKVCIEEGTKRVDIYTCAKEDVSKAQKLENLESSVNENRNKLVKIKEDIIERLEEKYDVDIYVHMKVDRENRFHARYLSNGEFHIEMERGFDFIRSTKEGDVQLKSFPFTLSPDAEEAYLGDFRMAPDAALTT